MMGTILRAKLNFIETVDGCALESVKLRMDAPDFVELTLGIGIDDESGRHSNVQELFNLKLCNPSWLSEQCSAGEIMIGRHLIIMTELHPVDFERRRSIYLSTCRGETPEQVYGMVSQLARSEFEGYDSGTYPAIFL